MQKKRFCLIYLAPVSSVSPPPNYLSRGSKPCNNQFWFHIWFKYENKSHRWTFLRTSSSSGKRGRPSSPWGTTPWTLTPGSRWPIYQFTSKCLKCLPHIYGVSAFHRMLTWPYRSTIWNVDSFSCDCSPLWKYKYINRSLRWRMGIVWWSAWLTMRWTMADTLARYSLKP